MLRFIKDWSWLKNWTELVVGHSIARYDYVTWGVITWGVIMRASEYSLFAPVTLCSISSATVNSARCVHVRERSAKVTRAQLPLLASGNYESCGSLTSGPAVWIGLARRVIGLKHKRRPCCPPHAPVYLVARALFRGLRLVVFASIRVPPAQLVRFAARTIFVRRRELGAKLW